MEASLFKPNFGMAPNISKKRKSVNHLVRISVYNRITVDPDADAGIFILPPPKFTGTNGALFCNIPLSERKISLENIVQLHPHKLKEEGKDASNTKAQTTLVKDVNLLKFQLELFEGYCYSGEQKKQWRPHSYLQRIHGFKP